MDQDLSINGIVPVAEPKASVECCVHVLVSFLILAAGLLSITAENSFPPVVEGQSTIYLAMMQ
jgi:hypothetical protein